MAGSVYKFVELIGSSNQSWEKAAKTAVERAARSLRDIRVAKVVEQDIHVVDGQNLYRVKVKLSFRVESSDEREFHKDPASWFLEKEHWGLDG
jgi:dodecin